jgi:prophage regulatory protein
MATKPKREKARTRKGTKEAQQCERQIEAGARREAEGERLRQADAAAQQKAETERQRRLVTFPELAMLGVRWSRRQVDRMEILGQFPRRVPLGANRVAWVRDEIIAFVEARIAKRILTPGRLGSGYTKPRQLVAVPTARVTQTVRPGAPLLGPRLRRKAAEPGPAA